MWTIGLTVVRSKAAFSSFLRRSVNGSSVCFTPGGGYSQKNWVGVCGPVPKTLTLFMTKICDFPYPIYDLTKNLIPYL